MADPLCLAEVRLWGRIVGAVVEPEDEPLVFEYAEEFRRGELEISPRNLPLAARGPQSFPALARLEAFEGLPGVLADALPDRFGNAIIRKYFADQGRPDDALSPVQKVLYVGSRAMGALEFRPAVAIPSRDREHEALEVADLVAAARRVVEGRTEVAIPEIMRLGASAGGARAKAVILWNPAANEVRSAFATSRSGDEHWLIKFDGVGDLGNPDPAPQPYNRIEYAYATLAEEAGIEVAERHLLEERDLAHFMTRRFDRSGGRRLHMHTLGGMEHVDFNEPGLYSYEQYFRVVLSLGLGYPALQEAFRRACFNLLAVNQDDHVKNFAFLMDERGRWRLSPAYDLTFARGRGYTRRHQMSFAGKRDDFTAEDFIEVSARFGLDRDGRAIVQQVGDALAGWPETARAAGVPEDRIRAIGSAFRLDCVPPTRRRARQQG
ncbi:MAG: type II toxin-antitoxin system HipA family toxin [bacterium]|nr:type II toxin-antitoxin system HipA family toxin [bacterium]